MKVYYRRNAILRDLTVRISQPFPPPLQQPLNSVTTPFSVYFRKVKNLAFQKSTGGQLELCHTEYCKLADDLLQFFWFFLKNLILYNE